MKKNLFTATALVLALAGGAALAGSDAPGVSTVSAQEAKSAAASLVRGTASRIAQLAVEYLGKDYEFGVFDCSAFTRHIVERALNVELPRRAVDQAEALRSISADDLRPGDLVFFNTLNRTYSHVGIFLGDNKFIHAPSSGKKVRIDSLDDAYWASRFTGARRVA